ncbi:MAG: 50S ribosomal protein L21 [Holosporaceae bacterium]|nr:50S ribosomal protein L21 [Holosporaceae bacterium]
MIAVIRTGGKQYKVREGDHISVEKLPHQMNASVEIRDVMLLNDNGSVTVGTPLINGAVISASVVEQKRRPTVLIFRKSRRKNFRRKNGHRQPVTILRIDGICRQ